MTKYRTIAALGLPLAAALFASSAAWVGAQAPLPRIGGGGPGVPMAPPPPPPPPPGAGDLPGGGMIPARPITPAMPTLPAMPPLPGTGGQANNDNTAATQPVTLRYRFHAGETLQYHVVMDINGSIQMGATGTKQPMKQRIEMTMTQKVKSVTPDDTATLAVTIGDMSLTMDGKTMPMPAQAQTMMQSGMTIVMTPTGQVQSVKGADGAPAMPTMGFSPTQFSQMAGLPDKPVSVGDTWRSNLVSAETGVETHVLYTLNSLSPNGSAAVIAQKIYMAFTPPKAVAKPGAATALPAGMKMNGLLTGTGTQQFDVTAGELTSQESNMHLHLLVNAATGGLPITTDFDIHINMELAGTAGPTPVPAPAAPGGELAPAGAEPPGGQLQ